MAKSRSPKRLDAGFSLGGEQAEADPLANLGFYESGLYSVAASRDDRRSFIVGRTGSGKSALLQRVEEEYSDHVIRINPEDLSLPYVADLGVLKWLNALNVNLDPLFIALWKHVFLVEIIRHRYKVDSSMAKQNFLSALTEKIRRDHSKVAALQYLEEFEGKFWCETHERVRDITTSFEQQISDEAGGKVSFPAIGEIAASSKSGLTLSGQESSQLAERFQRIVNATQLPRLNKMMSVLNDDILDSPQNFTYIVIDDLDRDWVDESILNMLIRCLFRTVLDLQRVRNLKVLVALRTNLFEQLNFGARTGGQEEKFRSMSIHVRWTASDLTNLLSARARASASRYGNNTIGNIMDLLPASNRTRGSALDYILRRTLLRPRDAIAYFNECLSRAGGKPRLSWAEIHESERSYSANRLLALRDEWKPTYPDIESLLRVFTSSTTSMSRKQLVRYLDDAVLLLGDPRFGGGLWMTELAEPALNGLHDNNFAASYQPIIRFLFGIGFLGCIQPGYRNQIYAYDQPDLMDQPSKVESAITFAVHPAFRAALDIGDPANDSAGADS